MAWARCVAAFVALAIVLTLGVPCSAAEAPSGAPFGMAAQRSLSEAAAARVARTAPPRFAQDASATTAGGASRPFFRTPTGVAAIVLMAVGSGYALYSVSNDQKPVKSPIR
ncbi:MAG: hypothetical protein ABW221_28425 [Vicinamibacteria bacterium]